MHHGGAGTPRTSPEIRKSLETSFLVGLGEKWLCPKASWAPYNPIPSHRSPSNPMGDHFLHNIMFSGPPCLPQKSPRPSRNRNPDHGVPKWVPGLKIPKSRDEKPCRIQWSVFQTEPYVTSYGRKPSWPFHTKRGGSGGRVSRRGQAGDLSKGY